MFVLVKRVKGNIMIKLTADSDGNVVANAENRVQYLETLIKIMEAVNVRDAEFRLKDIEIIFLALCVKWHLDGGDIGSMDARKYCEREMKVATQTIYNMRTTLKVKGWLRVTDIGYTFSNVLLSKNKGFILKTSDENK